MAEGIEEVLQKELERRRQAREAKEGAERDTKIAEYDKRIASAQTAFDALTSLHTEAKDLMANFAEGPYKGALDAREAIARSFEDIKNDKELAPLLAEYKITSLADLMEHPKFIDNPQVKGVTESSSVYRKEAREVKDAVGKRSVGKKEAIDHLATEDVVPPSVKYSVVVEALNNLISRLTSERDVLFAQTPEGQVATEARALAEEKAMNEEATKRVGDRRLYRRGDVPIQIVFGTAPSITVQYGTVLSEDVTDSAVYGVGTMKDAIRKHYLGVIESSNSMRKGEIQYEEAVDKVAKLPEQWEEVRKRLRDIASSRILAHPGQRPPSITNGG